MTEKRPQINLELNSGTFRIHTDQAIYHILVRPESTLSQVVDQIIDQGLGETPRPPPPPPPHHPPPPPAPPPHPPPPPG